MSPVLLDVNGLTTRFATRAGSLHAVEDVSFTVAEGEIIGLVGESGSGKSVTGFSILGLIDPPGRIVAGSVKLNGRELVGLSHAALRSMRGREIAMVFQDPSATLNPVLTIETQMRLAIAAHENLGDAAARARCIEVLGAVGIPDAARRIEAYPHQFSGGMRQRVAIAIALLNRPKLIICDEPTTALDVSIQAQILTEMKSLAARLLVMYAGRLIEAGPIAEVLRQPRHPYTRGLLGSLPGIARPGQDLVQIPGAMPSLIDLPQGCAFQPRCGFADALCATMPALNGEGARSFRCHHPLAAESAP
ncbi:MAG: ABC transporter ATP-binding protein [Hyphomicrobiales bacterium]|nr:ABC transporter ATP-binding protein [Hyphomicrobiales bacterium]